VTIDPGPLSRGVITQVTLVCDDLPEALHFYGELLGAEELYADDAWAVYRLAGLLVTLVSEREGGRMVAPTTPAAAPGARALVTVEVGDVDAVAEALTARGIVLLNGPVERPWGARTATFADPAGHLWEIAQEL